MSIIDSIKSTFAKPHVPPILRGHGGSSRGRRATLTGMDPFVRDQEWIALRKSNKTYEQIAKLYGVTGERIRQVLKRIAPELCHRDTLHLYHQRHPPRACATCKLPLLQSSGRLSARVIKEHAACRNKRMNMAAAVILEPMVDRVIAMRRSGAVWRATISVWGNKNPEGAAWRFVGALERLKRAGITKDTIGCFPGRSWRQRRRSA